MDQHAPRKTRRKQPRLPLRTKAKLWVSGQAKRAFQATLPTKNISVGGILFESSFFLKVGQVLDVELRLPPHHRRVHCRGEVVRIEQRGEKGKPESGFALSFTRYFDGSEVVLANYLLGPQIRDFVVQYAADNGLEAKDEWIAHVSDIVSEWELRKARPDPKRNGSSNH